MEVIWKSEVSNLGNVRRTGGKLQGQSTSGRIWVTNGETSCLVKSTELNSYLNIGFYRGRIINNEDKNTISGTVVSHKEVH